MIPELLKITELAQVAAATPHQAGHGPLLDALAARYPWTPFTLVAERDGRSWAPGIIDADGNRVSQQ